MFKINWFSIYLFVYDDRNFVTAAETITNRIAGPYWEAPLHPSVSQTSQNSRWIEDDTCSCMQASFGSFGFE